MRRGALLMATLLLSVACSTADQAEPGTTPSTAAGAEAGGTSPAATASTGTSRPSTTQPPPGTTRPSTTLGAAPASGMFCWGAASIGDVGPLSLVDVTEEVGLLEPLTGMFGHAAAWGDLDGDLLPDLVVGTFADKPIERYQERGATGPRPDTLLLGGPAFMAQPIAGAMGRTSGAAMVDLDNDGDLDVVLSRNAVDRQAGALGTEVYRNDGGALSPARSGIDQALGGRSVGVLDYDHDGLLDLFIAEDRYAGGDSRLYRNLGDLRFADTTQEAGLPAGIDGLGVATADLDRDGHQDLFVAGSNRLFLGTGSGFVEATLPVFTWETFGDEDDVAGAAFADVDRDGRLDLVVGHHFNSTVSRDTEVPVRLYLNRTERAGQPVFEDVTEAAGLVPLPTKAPHVELADLDNDGNLDVVTSASAANGTEPAVFMGLGITDGIPRFRAPEGLGSDQYWTTAPTVDVDRDGRLDIMAIEWFPTLPSRLFANRTDTGNWVSVSVGPELGPGVGTAVEVFAEDGTLLGYREITATLGYTAGSELIAHFGLGSVATVDVVITVPGGEAVTLEGVAANQHLRYPNGCG